MHEQKKHLEDLIGFIREGRSNEANFAKLLDKLEQESETEHGSTTELYQQKLLEIKEKQAKEYVHQKDKTGSAWPEFENFVAEFERAITSRIKED
jgi:hypothetical protein